MTSTRLRSSLRSGRPRTTALRAFNRAVLEDVDANPATLVVALRPFRGSSAE
jgi:hypothetical protein